MNALPCIHSMHADNYAAERGREEAREAAIETRSEELKADMWQDLEHLSDALGDAAGTVGYYRRHLPAGRLVGPNHPQAVTLLMLIRDGSDDLEAMQIIRKAMRQSIAEMANEQAADEMSE